ncbi:MAG: GNAT family N-acetyltransferase [Spirochaetales bacterium]|nr:GNAT family N-acetyltransferase [Spirochaetales bacterium]
MTGYKLAAPDVKYRNGFDIFFNNYIQSGEKLVPFVLKFYTGAFEEYVALLLGFPRGIGVPEGYIEHSTFWLSDPDGLIKGVVNIRHRLSDSLRREGGHIGYGVAPMYRGRGYATLMLKLALEKARHLGIERALITCDKGNVASARVARKNGGVLDSEEFLDGRFIQRYWIET